MRIAPLRSFVTACVLAAVLAAGSPAHASDQPARRQAAVLAGDFFSALHAFLGQATDTLRSLWSPAGEAVETGEAGDTVRGTAAKVPVGSDLLENGAGIDPNG